MELGPGYVASRIFTNFDTRNSIDVPKPERIRSTGAYEDDMACRYE